MKGLKRLILLLLISFLFVSIKGVKAFADSYNVYADSYILMEKSTKRVLAGNNIHKSSLPASITKILTCITAIENGNLDEYYKITKEAVNQEGSKVYFEINEEVKLIDLLYGMMLRSGNECAYMVSVCVSKSEEKFVELMNEKARMIGMKNSIFNNSSGLDENSTNHTTAYDMAILMSYCLDNEVFRKITETVTYSFKNKDGLVRTIENKHKLVKGYDFVTGGKTGDG